MPVSRTSPTDDSAVGSVSEVRARLMYTLKKSPIDASAAGMASEVSARL